MIKVLEIQYWSNRKVNLWLPIASNMPHSEEPACPFGNLLSTEHNYIGRRVISPKHILFDCEEETYTYTLNLRCSIQSYQKRYDCLKEETADNRSYNMRLSTITLLPTSAGLVKQHNASKYQSWCRNKHKIYKPCL